MTAPSQTQGGAAALPVTLMLAAAVLLAVVFANRSVLLQVRSAGHQLHAAQAHEAAQAGLAWALAQLNRPAPVGDDCQPSAEASAVPWSARAQLGPVQASCVAEGTGWACHCPGSGDARNVRGSASAFHVHLSPDPAQADRWQLGATGHGAQAGPPAELRLAIGRLPHLDTLPAAALAVRGQASFDGGIALTHSDVASGGVTLHGGGAITSPLPRLISTPGTPGQASVVSDDSALASLSATGLHASLFRMDRATWREQPAAVVVDCRTACDGALAEAARTHVLIALEGGLNLDTPLAVGTPDRPVVLVVDGPVTMRAAATVHGLVYARDATWQDDGGATIRGAVIAENDLQAHGPTHVYHDATTLRTLQQRGGTYAPIAGSWRDLGDAR